MRRALFLFVTAWLFLAGPCWAQDLQAIPPLTGRVVDAAGWLAAPDRQRLERLLAAEEARSGAQLAILIVATTKPEPIEAFSIRVVNEWKLGRRGVDDGVLLLVARDDRTLRIEVGRGLEGVIPDAVAKRIIEEQMLPAFRRGAATEGLETGVKAVLARLAGEALPPPNQPAASAEGEGDWLGWLLMALFLGGPVLRSLLGSVPGALLGAGGVGVGVGWLTGSALFGVGAAIMAFIFLIGGGRGGGGPGPWTSGGRSSGGFSGGGFSGGGGGFSGGGASGRW